MFFTRTKMWVLLVLGAVASVASAEDTLSEKFYEGVQSETRDYSVQIQGVESSLDTEREFSDVMAQFEKTKQGVKQTEVLPVINTVVWNDYVSQIEPLADDKGRGATENHRLDGYSVLEQKQSREFDLRYSQKAIDYLSHVNSVDW